jgi:hypothetical protein
MAGHVKPKWCTRDKLEGFLVGPRDVSNLHPTQSYMGLTQMSFPATSPKPAKSCSCLAVSESTWQHKLPHAPRTIQEMAVQWLDSSILKEIAPKPNPFPWLSFYLIPNSCSAISLLFQSSCELVSSLRMWILCRT